MFKHTVLCAAAMAVLALAAQTCCAEVVKSHFNGGVFWPTVPGSFEGMQKDTPQPHLTDRIDGWVIYNTDLLTGGKKAILIGEVFAAPGFDFQLNMGNLQMTKQNIHGLTEANHATIQFDGQKYDGLFGNLDFVGSDGLTYRLLQSGFTWEIKRLVGGSTALQPLVCSGYWNYQSISKQEPLGYLPPHAVITGLTSFGAACQEITLSSANSYIPPGSPATIHARSWTSTAGIGGSAEQLTLRAADLAFAHPGDSVDVTLTLTDSFFQTSEVTESVFYGNTAPTIASASAVDLLNGGMTFSAVCVDPDLTSPQCLLDPSFEELTLEFRYNSKTFLVGEGLVPTEKLRRVFGPDGQYMVFVRATDRLGDFDLEPLMITVTPEPASTGLLGLGLVALLRRRRGKA